MKKYSFVTSLFLLATILLLSSCDGRNHSEEEKEEQTEIDESNDEDNSTTSDLDGLSNEQPDAEPGLYDRTYLVESDGNYVYSLHDQDLIDKYDDLYAPAFQETIDSLKEVSQWQSQKYDFKQSASLSNLVWNKSEDSQYIQTGSYFEADYNFDLNNLGYTYVDLNSDGVFELLFGVLDYYGSDSKTVGYFERAYTLVDEKPVKVYEGGSRVLFWLGSDGYIYEYGSSGAAYSGTYKQHFNWSSVGSNNVDWETQGFIIDEFVGYWEVPVHIIGADSILDIDESSKDPNNQISQEEYRALDNEWNAKIVGIDWLKFSDYMQTHNLSY